MKDDFLINLYQNASSVFSLKELSLLFPNIAYKNLKSRANYYTKRGKLLKLRRGIYAKPKFNWLELATKLYTPSYISLETVLKKNGIIFQEYRSIFTISYLSRELMINHQNIIYRRLKYEILLNKDGVIYDNNFFIATKERAFLDAVYIYKNYHFDNLTVLNWDEVKRLQKIYHSLALEKRVSQYYKLFIKKNV